MEHRNRQEGRTIVQSAAGNGQVRPRKLCKFKPGGWIGRSVRLFDDGTVRSAWGSGSVVGARARVDQAGNRGMLGDARQAWFTVEGPDLCVVVRLRTSKPWLVKRARRFAAKTNRLAMRLDAERV
jgi:hypothetical protein